MKWLKASDYQQMPWKNGGGLTREIAIAKTDEKMLDWRLSLATIAQSGPFSQFAGVDRTIILLDGDTVRLDIKDKSPVFLEQSSVPFSFRGEWEVEAHVKGMATTDLNIMTCRHRYRHNVISFNVDNKIIIKGENKYTFIFFKNECNVFLLEKDLKIEKYDTIGINLFETLEIDPKGENVIFYKITIDDDL